MSDAMIVRSDATRTIAFPQAAVDMKESALATAALIGRVSTPDENATAVEAQVELKRFIDTCEKARKLCKEPVLDFSRAIDSGVKQFVDEVQKEFMRVTKLVADFQALMAAKQRAEEQARREELDKIEREKQAELAKAKSHEQLEAVQARYNEAARAVPAVKQVRAEGQKVSEEWEVNVTDIHLLYRHHPNCVSMTPLYSEIKALVKAGTIPKGVHAEKVVKSTVRVPAERRAIEV